MVIGYCDVSNVVWQNSLEFEQQCENSNKTFWIKEYHISVALKVSWLPKGFRVDKINDQKNASDFLIIKDWLVVTILAKVQKRVQFERTAEWDSSRIETTLILESS